MRHTLSPLQQFIFVLIFTGGAFILLAFNRNRFEYVPPVFGFALWTMLSTLISSFIFGSIYLFIEQWILRHNGRYPTSAFWFPIRHILFTATGITLTYLAPVLLIILWRIPHYTSFVALAYYLLIPLVYNSLAIFAFALVVALPVGWWESILLTRWTSEER